MASSWPAEEAWHEAPAQPPGSGIRSWLSQKRRAPLVVTTPHLDSTRAADHLVRNLHPVAALNGSRHGDCVDGTELDRVAPDRARVGGHLPLAARSPRGH